VGRLSLPARVGQLLMVGVGSTGLSDAEAAMLGRTHAGSVLLLGDSQAGLSRTQQVVADVRAAADRPERVGVLVAAEQEGGRVQRLSGSGFTDMPSAQSQAELSDDALTENARSWAEHLDDAGINVNLAPVADVVPTSLRGVNQPVGKPRRSYGSSPATVAAKVAAFTTGMDDAGVATAVRHFPGLGQASGDPDRERSVVDRVTTRRDPALRGFRAAVDAGVDMVMVSSAVYLRIDPRRQAVFSPTVLRDMIRGDLGFDGVIVSGDLVAPAVSNYPPGTRAVGFVRSGGDLVVVGDPAQAQTMAQALVGRAESDPAFARRVDESAGRVLALKARRGLATC
jgi:beta-N-acetylhexosaminidase